MKVMATSPDLHVHVARHLAMNWCRGSIIHHLVLCRRATQSKADSYFRYNKPRSGSCKMYVQHLVGVKSLNTLTLT